MEMSELCPRTSFTTRRLTPLRRLWVAKVWRRVWTDAPTMPQRLYRRPSRLPRPCRVKGLYTLLRCSKGFREAWRFLDALDKSPRVEVRVASAAIEREAYALLREFADEPLSFVDGVSLFIMRQERIQHAFAFDPHFARAGVLRIPGDLAL